MKALIIERPGALAVKDVPEAPMGDYDVRCKQLYGATCTGTDLHVIDGKFCEPVDYPSIIGHETIGQVVEAGPKVRNYKPGDLITRVGARATDAMKLSWGGMSEYGLACDHRAMEEDGLDPALWSRYRYNRVIPAGLIDPLDATMVITWRETLSYVKRIGVKPGGRVLVVGSGANGISIVAMAHNVGAAHVAMVGTASRRENTLATGVDTYLDYRDTTSLENYIAEHKKAVDVLVDATGKSGALNLYMPCLAEGGTLGVYGMDDFFTYALNPMLAGSFYVYNGGYDEPETHDEVMEMLRQGKLDAGNWLDRDNVFTWANAPDAYEFVRAKKAIKAVIKLTQD